MIRVINFSGGRTSAYMTLLCYRPGDIVLFCDTGREHPKTYKFVHDFETHEGIPIIWLKYDGGFERLISKRKMIPNIMMRFCTIELKIKTARRYLRSQGIIKYENYIGFRSDEQHRIKKHKERWKKVKTVFPLQVNKQHILDYWKGKPYDLEVPAILGNCDLCFLKGKAAIISIMRHYPELAEKWIHNEQQMNATYIKGISYAQLLQLSKQPGKKINLDNITPAYNCACTT